MKLLITLYDYQRFCSFLSHSLSLCLSGSATILNNLFSIHVLHYNPD
jgi:hypothetical protein